MMVIDSVLGRALILFFVPFLLVVFLSYITGANVREWMLYGIGIGMVFAIFSLTLK